MAEISGAQLIARSLKRHGVDYMFGIVGVPVIPVAFSAMQEGIQYFGMRHEQSASYSAQAGSYLARRPGARQPASSPAGAVARRAGGPGSCLVVSGPGMTNAISGLANAWSNCWPMVLLGGSSDAKQAGMGAFHEARQMVDPGPR